MSEEFRFNEGTRNDFLSRDETSPSQHKELADLKSQIYELRELMETQKNNSTTGGMSPSSNQQEDSGFVTFRDIQQARSIYSMPENNHRGKNQMYHYISTNEHSDLSKKQTPTYRQPLEIQYIKSDKVKQPTQKSKITDDEQLKPEENQETPEQEALIQNSELTETPIEQDDQQTVEEKTEEIKIDVTDKITADEEVKEAVKEENTEVEEVNLKDVEKEIVDEDVTDKIQAPSPSLATLEQIQTKTDTVHDQPATTTTTHQMSRENQHESSTETNITKENGVPPKRSVFEYILGKIKSPT